MIKFFVSAILIIPGLFILGAATLGIFRFRYVLNRLHVVAKCDTLGAFLVLSGLMVAEGLSFTTLKLLLIIAFLWLSNPVASHLISKTEVLTNPEAKEKFDFGGAEI